MESDRPTLSLMSLPLKSCVDRIGCFSRPDDSLEHYQEVVFSWNRSDTGWSYPEKLREIFSLRFAVDIQNIPIETSSKGLMPWELACCWIDREGRGGIQVRPIASSQQRVPFEVVLFHEAIHAIRGRLEAPIFEEYIAYAACRSAFPVLFPRWRMWTGPLFSSVREVVVLLVLLWAMWIVPVALDVELHPFAIGAMNIVCLAYFLFRLKHRWKIWHRAMKSISTVWPEQAWALMVRMSDEEIYWLASIRKKDVRQAVQEKASLEWRWRYFLRDILKA